MNTLIKPFTQLRLRRPGMHMLKSDMTLQLSISSLITILLVVLGTTITWYTYENQKRDTLKSTGEIFERSAMQTSQNIATLMGPVETFINLSTQLEMVGTIYRERRLELLPYFVQALRNTPWLANVAVGYTNGDFLVVWALRGNEKLMKQTSAPADAAYLVKIIERNPGEPPVEKYLYYDKDINFLSKNDGFQSGYDPRTRPWYQQAMASDFRIRTAPYRFVSTGQTGITVAHRLPEGRGVVAADLIMDSLADTLKHHKLTDNTRVVIFDENGTVLAYTDKDALQEVQTRQLKGNINVLDLERDELSQLYNESIRQKDGTGSIITTDQGDWFSIVTNLSNHPRRHAYLAIATPLAELTADAREMARENLLIAVAVILIAILLGLIVSKRIASSMHTLDLQAERIREFDFETPLTVSSRIKEVTSLASTMTVMKTAIQRFIEIARSLSAEQKMERVLELILQDAMAVTSADGGSVALVSDDGSELRYALIRNDATGIHIGGNSNHAVEIDPVQIERQTGTKDLAELSVIRHKKSVSFEDIATSTELDFKGVRERHESGSYRCISYLALPLLNRQHEVIGILQLVNARDRKTEDITGFGQAYEAYVHALASNAALALDNNRLLRAQKDLFDAFVQLIAGAIDTKSPYTGGHCQRVPVLAELLAQEASRSKLGPFNDFTLSEDESYELYVASWLHDCGKVTTPEYVVDKATKLETIYNRIHEIRMRFEVLWRDAEIAYHEGLADAPGDKARLRDELERHHQQLLEDFAFVAASNVGGEFMDPDDIDRVKQLAKQTWVRHFDDRLGLSEDEMQLRKNTPPVPTPAIEHLLADKQEHLVPRTDDGNPFGDNPYDFKMDVPNHAFNLGEISNLCIARGTLTDEDRFKINDHIVQTINMLNKLPFPKELKRVPEWAGNHHEKLDGTGYPRRLNADDLSIPERIMGIADIFEALTAADRPYKKAKTLSDSVRILSFMRNDGHICPDLFDLFLTSGIYRKYAEEHLRPEQIDDVDISQFVRKPENNNPQHLES